MNLKQLWKQFDKDAEACYSKWNGEIRMDWSDDEIRTWQKAYETVKAILAAGREKDPAFCREMKDLDEEEKSFVLKEQKKILASPLKMLLLNIKRNKPL